MVKLLGIALLMSASGAAAEKPIQASGFNCIGENGAARAFNVDLKKKQWFDGEKTRKIPEVNKSYIRLIMPNPDLIGNNGGFGPIIDGLSLDRNSLILTEKHLIPFKGIDETKVYQCHTVDLIDFSAARRF